MNSPVPGTPRPSIHHSGTEHLHIKVIRVTEYASSDEMLDHEDPVAITGDPGEDRDELLMVIRRISLPGKENRASDHRQRTAP